MSETGKREIFGRVDAAILAEVRTLIEGVRHGALASLEPASGHPICTRVGLATLADGTPLIFVSALAAHTPALIADPRCSLLVGNAGKGDPLAHARITLRCTAAPIGRETGAFATAMQRYLQCQPKARLYAELPDFMLFALAPSSASFNAGFGKAYRLTAQDWTGAFESANR